MNLSKLARLFGKASVYTRDVNAVARGRMGERLFNRVAGRLIKRATRGMWR